MAPPEVELGLPPDFHDLPLVLDPGPDDSDGSGRQERVNRAAGWRERAEEFLRLVPVDRPGRHHELALAHLAAYAKLLRAGGVVKAATCVGRSAGGLSTAAVMVSWVRAGEPAAAEVAALGLYQALRARSADRDVYVIELPVGPAVAVIAERTLTGSVPTGDPVVDGEGVRGERGGGRQVTVAVRSIEVSIPVDGLPWILVVALSSPSLFDWDNYEAVMAQICRSIRILPEPGQLQQPT